VKTLHDIAALLRYVMLDVDVEGRQLWARPHGKPRRVVARLNLSDAVILVPEYDGPNMVLPARMVRRGEDVATVATEIVCRVLRLQRAA
jgi:hypothetical protein